MKLEFYTPKCRRTGRKELAKSRADHLYVRANRVRQGGVRQFIQWPRTVPVTFDVSVRVAKGALFWGAVLDLAESFARPLETVDLHTYQDVLGGVEYLFRVYYRDPTGQLTKEEAASAHERFLAQLEELVGRLT